MRQGQLFIIAAPSGGGKTSLVSALCQSDPLIQVSISHTTRPIRPGEQEGQAYYFISPAQFSAMVAAQDFLEYAQVYDAYYGTSTTSVDHCLNQGQDVILEIDWQGARQIRARFPASCSIFILPPSLESLAARLIQRGQDDPAIIAQRMQQAKNECSHWSEFDYLVINDEFDTALADLRAIIQANRLATRHQAGQYQDLLSKLV